MRPLEAVVAACLIALASCDLLLDIESPLLACSEPPCPVGTPCVGPEDCESEVCSEENGRDQCKAHSCFLDQIQNGNESDVNCGGDECEPCGPGQACVADADCFTFNCVDGICSEPAECGMCLDPDVPCGGDMKCVYFDGSAAGVCMPPEQPEECGAGAHCWCPIGTRGCGIDEDCFDRARCEPSDPPSCLFPPSP